MTHNILHLFIFSVAHRVHCEPEMMRVEVVLPNTENSDAQIYLDGMKGYPNPKCQPEVKDTLAEFKLSLTDIYECGVTRVVNKITVRQSVRKFFSY